MWAEDNFSQFTLLFFTIVVVKCYVKRYNNGAVGENNSTEEYYREATSFLVCISVNQVCNIWFLSKGKKASTYAYK